MNAVSSFEIVIISKIIYNFVEIKTTKYYGYNQHFNF